jgi:hypothetical protein
MVGNQVKVAVWTPGQRIGPGHIGVAHISGHFSSLSVAQHYAVQLKRGHEQVVLAVAGSCRRCWTAMWRRRRIDTAKVEPLANHLVFVGADGKSFSLKIALSVSNFLLLTC